MSQYLDKDGASRIAENFLSKQAEQDTILRNLQFDLKEAEHALVKTIQGPAPLNIRALTRPLDDYVISGNTLQNGTPTPEAPVDVVGCGVRTGNLFDKDNAFENYYLNNGAPTPYNIGGYVLSDYIPIASNTATISARNTALSGLGSHWAVYDENKTFIRGGIAFDAYKKVGNIAKVVDTSGAAFIRVDYATKVLTDCMLNLGSTAKPHEPYGFKLPLTVNGTEYPIFLGEVQTTRRIKKLVLTGDEDWTYSTSGAKKRVYLLGFDRTSVSLALCSHFTNTGYTSYPDAGYFAVNNSSAKQTMIFGISDMQVSDVSGWTQYLAQQYAAGMPVAVWYVLAEPVTAITNEPLHKIGDYADTISFAQAGVEISTVKGFNTVTTDTTVLPYNIEVKGVINNA